MKQGDTVPHVQRENCITPRSAMKQGDIVPHVQRESCITPIGLP